MKGEFKNFFTKDYFEEYSRLVLSDLCDISLVHRKDRYGSDRPDLISNDETMGIEVTNGISEEEGRHNKLFQQIYPRENRIEILKKEAKRLRVEKDLYIVDGIASLKFDDSKLDRVNLLSKIVNKKLEKLNEVGYNIYSINCLYVSAFHYFREDIETFLENFNNSIKKYSLNFDIIYIFNVEGLYVFDGLDYTLYPVSNNQINGYKRRALEFSKNLLNN